MKTETINGIEYNIGKLDPFEQMHVGRRLAPLLAHAMPAFMSIVAQGDIEKRPDIEIVLLSGAGIPIAEVLAKMSNEDVDYVIHQCLSVCQRKQKNGWAKVFANGVLMFADIEGDTLVALTKHVVEVSLGRFFPTGQSESTPAAE
jgi:hypothetical protein